MFVKTAKGTGKVNFTKVRLNKRAKKMEDGGRYYGVTLIESVEKYTFSVMKLIKVNVQRNWGAFVHEIKG